RKGRGRRADTERDDHGRCDREAGRSAKRPKRVADVLTQQIPVHRRRVADDFGDCPEPQCKAAGGASLSLLPRKQLAHLVAVLVAKRSRVKMQKPVVCAHRGVPSALCPLRYAFPGAKPAERAILTSWASRRTSAFTAAAPAGVIR